MHSSIGFQSIGKSEPVFVIAEISANHNQSLDKAKELVRQAARAGANAVKTQTYTPRSMTIKTEAQWGQCDPRTIWAGESLYDLYARAFMPPEWNAELQEEAEACGIAYLSTAYDKWSARYLAKREVAAIKIASFELTDYDFLRYVGGLDLPVILSTGMATWPQVDSAVRALRFHRGIDCDLILLHCVSEYPADRRDLNLSRIRELESFDPDAVGFSDHTRSMETPARAVYAGARVIEKHFMLEGTESPDSTFSLTPGPFSHMVGRIRDADYALGCDPRDVVDQTSGPATCKRSVFSTCVIKRGEVLGYHNTRTARPLAGIPAQEYPSVLGTRAFEMIPADTPILRSMLDESIDQP